ncbi:hypothetical protein ACP70R_039680 [Stipagrostis hirtigluma subsp. patula]
MAMRNLATRTWTLAAAALRHQPRSGVPPSARSRFLGTVCNCNQRSNGKPNLSARRVEDMDDEELVTEL